MAEETKRVIQVQVEQMELLARVLDIPGGQYNGMMVNNSWPEKGLLSGDIILFRGDAEPKGGDIVLIEDEGYSRIGLLADSASMDTPDGPRPIEPTEKIIGVGLALLRRLQPDKPVDIKEIGGD